MKKMIYLAAGFAAMLGATSCSDELESEKTSTPEAQTGRLCSYTNLIVSANEIGTERVAVSSSNLGIKNENPNLSYTIEPDAEGYHLVTHVNGSMLNRYFDEVTITDGTKTETLMVTIDPAEVASRGFYNNDEDVYQNKAVDIIGYGVDYLGTIGEYKKPIIDFNRFNNNREDLHKALNINTNVLSTSTYLAKGTSLTQISNKVEEKMGMKVKFPVKCANVSAGFDKTHFKETSTSEQRDYMLASVNTVGFEAALDIESLIEVAYKISSDAEKEKFSDNKNYASLLSITANNILNNSGSVGQDGSNNIHKRALDIITTLGTHVVTEAQFGGYAQVSYDKLETSSKDEVEDFLGYELSVESNTSTTSETTTKNETKDEKSGDTKTSVVKAVVGKITPSLSFNNSTKESKTDIRKQLDSHTYTLTRGGIRIGDPDNLQSWACGDIAKMTPLTYATASTIKALDDKIIETNKSLIPIYMFCTDADLRKELEKLLTPDADGVLPYYNEVLKGDEDDAAAKNDELVIADVKLVSFGTMSLDANIYTPLTMTDSKGKSHTYYPMVTNAECTIPAGEVGRVFTVNSGLYTEVDITRRMICYYALEPASKCNGITDIRLMTEEEYKYNQHTNEFRAQYKYYTGGPNNNIDIEEGPCTDYGHVKDGVRTCLEGYRHLYVTYGTSETPKAKKIKAVAWHYGKPNECRKGSYFCSSGGAEYSTNNDFTEKEHKAFREYWTSSDTKCTSTFDNGVFTRYQREEKTSWLCIPTGSDWHFLKQTPLQPVYSTRSIYRNMTPVVKYVNNRPTKVLPVTYPI